MDIFRRVFTQNNNNNNNNRVENEDEYILIDDAVEEEHNEENIVVVVEEFSKQEINQHLKDKEELFTNLKKEKRGECSICFEDVVFVKETGNLCHSDVCKNCVKEIIIENIYKCPICRKTYLTDSEEEIMTFNKTTLHYGYTDVSTDQTFNVLYNNHYHAPIDEQILTNDTYDIYLERRANFLRNNNFPGFNPFNT